MSSRIARFLVIGILCSSLFSCDITETRCKEPPVGLTCALPSEIEIGMEWLDLRVIVKDFPGFFVYYSFLFFTYDGMNVIVEDKDVNGRLFVGNIVCYPSISAHNGVFANIEVYEDDIYSVVEKVGLPFASYTSGAETMMFRSSNGNEYCFYFQLDECYRYVVYYIAF